MNLRTKLFLLIGGIFVVVFLLTQALDQYLTSESFWKIESDVHRLLLSKAEKRAMSTDTYIKEVLDWEVGEINLLLDKVRNVKWENDFFAPSDNNIDSRTWMASATFLDENKSLDLIQVTFGKEVSSLIILAEPPPRLAREIPVEGTDIKFCVAESEIELGKWEGPFVVIPFGLHKDFTLKSRKPDITDIDKPLVENYNLLYSINAIVNADLQEFDRRMRQIPEYMVDMLFAVHTNAQYIHIMSELKNRIEKAQRYLKQNPDKVAFLQETPLTKLIAKEVPNYQELQKRDIAKRLNLLQDLKIRYDQIEMVWQLTVTTGSGIYGADPFNKMAPIGITKILPNEKSGQMLFATDVFYRFPIMCLGQESCAPPPSKDEPTIRTIYDPQSKRLFLGNIIGLEAESKTGERKQGSFAIAVDSSYLVRRLALASNSTALYVSNDQVMKAYDAEGVEISSGLSKIPINKMLASKSGIFDLADGESFYYVHLDVEEGLDMHFFLLVPKATEFEVVNFLKNRTQQLAYKIGLQMNGLALLALLIVILLVNNVVRHITNPIRKLAEATNAVGEGHLEEIDLPPIEKKSKDEIESLYESFYNMVVGLREKERVKGVLNKVVSPTIAEEILKGNVQLGGEEKVVTVLFADIRHFTEITEKMDPQQLIEILNACMTKISTVIDEMGGVIDKYVGDEVMALFGAPIHYDDSTYKSIICAVKIREVISKWNEERVPHGEKAMEMGIGIHTGKVIAGNMGAENRLNYTVLGANVNLGVHLCDIAKPHEILISEDTYKSPFVQENVEVTEVESVQIKGFEQPVKVYSVLRMKDADH
ncbi:MAG: adenylate/guanylate cyclase domain-containing protein [Simkaniaceae bacterium]|nr:adenylate/guanylate cyclase domain-containing protein [Simkaniaceae bacterium]